VLFIEKVSPFVSVGRARRPTLERLLNALAS